jgi:hypothetical protein
MRIKAISTVSAPPIKKFEANDMSSVVVLAGPNGVGKSRLIAWLLTFLQNLPTDPNNWVIVEATSDAEKMAWQKGQLDSRSPQDVAKLKNTLQRQRNRYGYASSILNFESDRKIAQVKPYSFNWNYDDPYMEQVGWNYGFQSLSNRWQDTVHTIFRKVRSRREKISAQIDSLSKSPARGPDSADARSKASDPTNKRGERYRHPITIDMADFPDPIEDFKEAFHKLLGPKKLVDPDPKDQRLFYEFEGEKRPVETLSSGEREVLNIVFDFLLQNPTDCVVVFDEPELHLHPELSHRLLHTLRTIGRRNQFIFCTHSAEIISASLDSSVLFITPPKVDGSNQAIAVRENDDTHEALRLIGQSIGIVSLGKKIVLIEGDHGSLDKETYGSILKGQFPDLVLVPTGGKEAIQSFAHLADKVLTKSVWGVEFFMLADRDAVPATQSAKAMEASSNQRMRVLSKYHLENYFLDEATIALIFSVMEEENSWLRDPSQIRAKLLQIARDQISYATALIVSAEFRTRVGNLNIMPSGCHNKTENELIPLFAEKAKSEKARIESAIDFAEIEAFARKTFESLESSLDDPALSWKNEFPGRQILKQFCSGKFADIDFGRFKTAYIAAAESAASKPFAEVEEIFRAFAVPKTLPAPTEGDHQRTSV